MGISKVTDIKFTEVSGKFGGRRLVVDFKDESRGVVRSSNGAWVVTGVLTNGKFKVMYQLAYKFNKWLIGKPMFRKGELV